jgi:molybdopterin-containing oxidoreductase family membrane subunit
VLESRAFWHGLFTPLHMIAAAYVSGVALLAIVFYTVGRLRLVGWERAVAVAQPAVRLLLGIGLTVLAIVVARQLLAGLMTADVGLRAATDLLLTGPLAPEFVGLRLIGGIALPLLLIVIPQTRTPLGLVLAGALAMVGVFVDRLTFVIAGQAAPVTTVSGVVSAPVAVYTPSLVEIAIVIGGLALVAFAYTLSERYLDLSESDAHVSMLPAWALAWFAFPGRVTRRAAALMPPLRLRRRVRAPAAGEGPTDPPAPGTTD